MFGRFPHFAAVVSILCGVLVFFLFRFFPPKAASSQTGSGGYAVLALDESRDDRHIRELLARGGIKDTISESSQEVPVDNFGVLKMIPLDSFRNEIETFDPRDDGYAAKLRSFFVRDGKRFFFIPLVDTFGVRAWTLKKQVSSLLSDIPFSFTVLEQGKPLFWYFLLLAGACALALYFSRSPGLFIFELPLLLAFCRGGVYGFFLAAALAGIWELLREPLEELSAARRYDRVHADPFRGNYAGAGLTGLRERLRPFGINKLLVLIFVLFFVVFSAAGGISPFPAAAGGVSFILLYFLAFRAEAARIHASGHMPFVPVPLLPFRSRSFSLFPFLVPFGAASVLALFLPLAVPGFSPFLKGILTDTRYLVSSADYDRHIAFEESFSYRTFNEDLSFKSSAKNSAAKSSAAPPAGKGALNEEGYLRYYLGDDGLIGGSTVYEKGSQPQGSQPQGREAVGPRFPLETLMEFLLQYSETGVAGSMKESKAIPDHSFGASFSFLFASKEWISVLLIFAASSLNFLRPGIRSGKKKPLPVFEDKRIAA